MKTGLKGGSLKLAVLLMFFYCASYLTRLNFGAIITEMASETGIAQSFLSISLTCSFITYGAGQFLSGYLGDKIQPKKLLIFGFCLTSAMNLAMAFVSDYVVMAVLWAFNGLAQAFMWPPIVRIMIRKMKASEYDTSSVLVNIGGSVGSVLIYLVSPLLISIFDYRAVFISGAVIGILVIPLVILFCPSLENDSDIGREEVRGDTKEERHASVKILSLSALVLYLSIIAMGALRDGVTTWLPSLVNDTFSLGGAVSILSGVALPLFSIICFYSSKELHARVFRNPAVCAGVIFALGALSSFILYLFIGKSAAGSVIAASVLAGSMHGVNMVLISILPSYFSHSKNVSFITGILNAGVYIGSATSILLSTLVTDRFGWGMTSLVWVGISVLGTVFCFSVIKLFKTKK